MALNRSTWLEIKDCAETFCTLDDYNWDWVLQTISEKCMKNKMNVITAEFPRVFHIGEWWVFSLYVRKYRSTKFSSIYKLNILNFQRSSSQPKKLRRQSINETCWKFIAISKDKHVSQRNSIYWFDRWKRKLQKQPKWWLGRSQRPKTVYADGQLNNLFAMESIFSILFPPKLRLFIFFQ